MRANGQSCVIGPAAGVSGPRLRAFLPSMRVEHSSTRDFLSSTRAAHSSTRAAHSSTRDSLPSMRSRHSSASDSLSFMAAVHSSTREPPPSTAATQSSGQVWAYAFARAMPVDELQADPRRASRRGSTSARIRPVPCRETVRPVTPQKRYRTSVATRVGGWPIPHVAARPSLWRGRSLVGGACIPRAGDDHTSSIPTAYPGRGIAIMPRRYDDTSLVVRAAPGRGMTLPPRSPRRPPSGGSR